MNYIIKYSFYGNVNIINKKMRIKNKPNEFMVKASFSNYIEKKYGKGKLVIHSCQTDIPDFFNNIFK